MVVDGSDDGVTHILQRLVHINHQRVLFTTVGHQIVAPQLGRVIGGYLLLDARAFDAGIGREQLILAGCIGQVITDIPCHGQLRVQGQNLCIGLATLYHIHAGSRLYIGQKVFAFVRRYIFVHMAKFLLNHAKAVVDKGRSADGNLVLVFYPIFVVDSNHRVQDILSPLHAYILE